MSKSFKFEFKISFAYLFQIIKIKSNSKYLKDLIGGKKIVTDLLKLSSVKIKETDF